MLQNNGKVWRERSDCCVGYEFDRSKTFYPKLGLIQLVCSNQPDKQYLIDPVALSPQDIAEQSLAELFSDEQVVKVLHACTEDIEVLLHHLGLRNKKNRFATFLILRLRRLF